MIGCKCTFNFSLVYAVVIYFKTCTALYQYQIFSEKFKNFVYGKQILVTGDFNIPELASNDSGSSKSH